MIFYCCRFQAAFGNDKSGAWERQGVDKTTERPCRHSGIFIPPAHDSGIANWRWRNENIRNLRRQAVAGSHRSPDPLAREIPDIFIPLTRNENSGMTTGGGDYFTSTALGNDKTGTRFSPILIWTKLCSIIPPVNTHYRDASGRPAKYNTARPRLGWE